MLGGHSNSYNSYNEYITIFFTQLHKIGCTDTLLCYNAQWYSTCVSSEDPVKGLDTLVHVLDGQKLLKSTYDYACKILYSPAKISTRWISQMSAYYM